MFAFRFISHSSLFADYTVTILTKHHKLKLFLCFFSNVNDDL